MKVMAMTPELTALVNTARTLSPTQIRQVAEFADFLKSKNGSTLGVGQTDPLDEPYDWSDEELLQLSIATFQRFEAEHPDDDWGEDYAAKTNPKD